MYENRWKCGELKLYFSPSAGGLKKKKYSYHRLQKVSSSVGSNALRLKIHNTKTGWAHSGRRFAGTLKAVSEGSGDWVRRPVQRTQRVSLRRQITAVGWRLLRSPKFITYIPVSISSHKRTIWISKTTRLKIRFGQNLELKSLDRIENCLRAEITETLRTPFSRKLREKSAEKKRKKKQGYKEF